MLTSKWNQFSEAQIVLIFCKLNGLASLPAGFPRDQLTSMIDTQTAKQKGQSAYGRHT